MVKSAFNFLESPSTFDIRTLSLASDKHTAVVCICRRCSSAGGTLNVTVTETLIRMPVLEKVLFGFGKRSAADFANLIRVGNLNT